MFPVKSNPSYSAYEKAKAEQEAIFAAARAPHWKRYLDGEISHAAYCKLIAKAWRTYCDAIHESWVAAGGFDERHA